PPPPPPPNKLSKNKYLSFFVEPCSVKLSKNLNRFFKAAAQRAGGLLLSVAVSGFCSRLVKLRQSEQRFNVSSVGRSFCFDVWAHQYRIHPCSFLNRQSHYKKTLNKMRLPPSGAVGQKSYALSMAFSKFRSSVWRYIRFLTPGSDGAGDLVYPIPLRLLTPTP
ncbi:hypothetical protein, partial [Bartonella sp. LJL80]